jgi:ribosomal protein L16 Arg81 hydroxylase
MKTTLEQIKNLFTSNFATLSPRVYDLNAATLKVSASFEYEGEFTEPELIVNVYDNVINEEESATMIQMFNDDVFEEVNFKSEKDDYIITAGCSEAVYSLRLQIIRIK